MVSTCLIVESGIHFSSLQLIRLGIVPFYGVDPTDFPILHRKQELLHEIKLQKSSECLKHIGAPLVLMK